MYELLQQAGVKTIHEISRCKDYEEYQTMSQANFNLVLHPEARFAAEDFHDRLKIPFIELRRLYQTDKIEISIVPWDRFLESLLIRKCIKSSRRGCGAIPGDLSGCVFCCRGVHERRSL